MFYRHNEEGYLEVAPGVSMKTLTFGEKMSMTEFRLEKGNLLPEHSHPHEQIGYLVSGYIRLKIGEDEKDIFPGDSWSIPGGVSHCAEIIEASVAIEVFSPVRKDYLQTGESVSS